VTLVKIPERELYDLRRKAQAHDTMLTAMRVMADRSRTLGKPEPVNAWDKPVVPVHPLAWDEGWQACWREVNETILASRTVYAAVLAPREEADELPF
jgi:hypothetical protein